MANETTTTTKITKREAFTKIWEILMAQSETELAAVVEHEVELLNKRASTPRKSEEAVAADNKLADEILATLSAGALTVSDMQKRNSALSVNEGVSCSKITSLLTNVLLPAGKVKREVIKRKAYYSLV